MWPYQRIRLSRPCRNSTESPTRVKHPEVRSPENHGTVRVAGRLPCRSQCARTRARRARMQISRAVLRGNGAAHVSCFPGQQPRGVAPAYCTPAWHFQLLSIANRPPGESGDTMRACLENACLTGGRGGVGKVRGG